MFETNQWEKVPSWWAVHPNHVGDKVAQWEQECEELLQVHRAVQFTDETVYALVITDPQAPIEGKKRAAFLNVHTPEYGACAGIMNFASMLLTGQDLLGNEAPFDAGKFRKAFVVTLIPDSNPQGKLRLPYALTDGSVVDNRDTDTVNKLLYGVCSGKPFRRCASWKMSEEHVECTGAIYEKISPDAYVIPDMDERSTVFKLLYSMFFKYEYQMVGFIHQAEFIDMDENCYCATSIEPWIPEPISKLQDVWASYIVEHWQNVGGKPVEEIDHHKWGAGSWVTDPATGLVRKMGIDYVTLQLGCPSVVVETQMNDPKTPLEEQMRLTAAAIEASLRFLENYI